MSDRRKLHELISETLEPKPTADFEESKCYSPKFFWTRENMYSDVRPWISNYNYDTDEAASAMLLEAMPPWTKLEKHYDYWRIDWPHGLDNHHEEHADRKIAIVDAYAKWKGIEVTRETCGEEGS